MQPLSPSELKGLWAPVLPTFAPDERLDQQALERELERLLAAGIHGVDDGGARAENAALEAPELELIARTVAERCERAGTPFLLGVGSADPQLALREIERARELEPSAIGVVLPTSIEPRHPDFAAILASYSAAAAPIGIVLDHPPHVRIEFPPELCGPIREAAPGVIGIRLGLGSEEWYARWREAASDLSLFVPGHHHATGVARGANGSCSNFAWLSLSGALRLHELCGSAIEQALDLESQLQCFLITHILPFQIEEGFSSAALDKLLAAAGGWMRGSARLRAPEVGVGDEMVAQVREAALQEIPWFFEGRAGESASEAAA